MSIGIVGTGIGGLTLALYLQQAGIETTVYAERSADAIRAARLMNTVARFPSTQARERALGVEHWADAEHAIRALYLHVGDELTIVAEPPEPMSVIDFRIYLARLLEDYEQRGGTVVISPDAPEQVTTWSHDHDLMVVASGRETVSTLFPRDPMRSLHVAPQRRLCAGLYHGIAYADPEGVVYALSPGIGEVFTMPFLTFEGWVSSILVEAIPGGPLEPVTWRTTDLERSLLDTLETYARPIADRIDRDAFQLTRPDDLLQGAITPTVRKLWTRLETGRYAIAIGDAWVLNDPVVAQGANLASATAWIAGEAIRRHHTYDDAFCRELEIRAWNAARPAVEFTNAFLAPPAPHVLEILQAAAQDRRVADAFAARFVVPAEMWDAVATPEHAATFLAGARG